MLRIVNLLLCLFCLVQTSSAYTPGINALHKSKLTITKDSGKKVHSPTRAAIYSAVIPGLGQAYNKKYWKMPIVYGLMGVSAYFITTNQKKLKKYKTDLNFETDTFANTSAIHFPLESLERLKANRDYHKQNRDYAIIAMGLVYVLNIVDATVDAHLFEFNVNQNLTARIEPRFNPYGMRGARLTFNF